MKLSLYEQETIILYNQAEVVAEVYTHDPRLLEKLRRLAEKYPDQIVKKDRQTFLVPKRCVSVREPYSAERRKAASELAKAAGYRPPTPKKGNEYSKNGCRLSSVKQFHRNLLLQKNGFVGKCPFTINGEKGGANETP